MVSGKITDNGTGLPLEGVRVRLEAFKSAPTGGTETVSSDVDSTDVEGQYSLEVEGKNIESIALKIEKPGYVPPPFSHFKNGSCEIKDFALNPIDAWLRLILSHQSSSTDNIYYYLQGPLFQDPRTGYKGVLVPSGEQKVQDIIVPGGQMVTIVWDTVPSPFKTQKQDSVFCPHKDTTSFALKF